MIINILHLVVQYEPFRLPIWPILRANISPFIAQYHPYCTPIWPILQRGLYVIENQLLRNPFSIVLPQPHSPLLWRGRGRLSNLILRSFGGVGGGSPTSFSPLLKGLREAPSARSPSLWEGRGRYLEELNRAFGEATKALFPPFHRYFPLHSP